MILAQDHIAAPVQAVLAERVGAPERRQGIGIGLLRGEAGEGIGDLSADPSRLLADALDAADLGGGGPAEMRYALAADAELPGLDAAVALLDGLRAGDQVGGRLALRGGRMGRADRFQRLDQFRGERRRRRRGRCRPSVRAGWL